jgi:hypothetical protein
MFIHTVYFWLTEGTPDPARRQLEQDCKDLLSRIPTVRQLWAGRPADTNRPVVDRSYDVGLSVVLDDAAGHDVYQEHELHKQFIARHKPNWKRVQVYDFEE